MNTVFHLRVGTLGTLPTAESQVHVQGPFPLTLPASCGQCKKAVRVVRTWRGQGRRGHREQGGRRKRWSDRATVQQLPPQVAGKQGGDASRALFPPPRGPQPPQAPRRTLRPSRLFTASSHRPSRPRCLRGRRWGGLRSPRAPRIQCLPLPLLAHPPRGQSQTQHCLGGGGSQLGGDFVSSGPDTLWRHFDRHSWCGVGATGIRQVEARDAARLPAGHRTVQTRRPAHTSTVPEPGAPALNGPPGLAPSPCPPPSQGNTS